MSRSKVVFRLQQDDEGYPPASTETIWAEKRVDGSYELDNVPFFEKEATLGDIVLTTEIDGQNVFVSLFKASSNSLVRVIMYDVSYCREVRESLNRLGCDTELSHIPSLFAVNIPSSVDYRAVIHFLCEHAQADVLDYEEAIIRHHLSDAQNK